MCSFELFGEIRATREPSDLDRGHSPICCFRFSWSKIWTKRCPIFRMRPGHAIIFPRGRRACLGSSSLLKTRCGCSSQQNFTPSPWFVARMIFAVSFTSVLDNFLPLKRGDFFLDGALLHLLNLLQSPRFGGVHAQTTQQNLKSALWRSLRSVRVSHSLSFQCTYAAGCCCHRCGGPLPRLTPLHHCVYAPLPTLSYVQPAGFWAFKGFILGGLSFNELSQIEPRKVKPAKGGRERRG